MPPRYGWAHQQERKRWVPIVANGNAYCWRCGNWLPPDQPWDLGHSDTNTSVWMGPECWPCNRGTAAARGNRQRGKPKPRWTL